MKYYIITSIVSLAIGAAVALKLRPPVVKTETRTEVKTNTVVETRRVKYPNGKVETNVIRNINKQESRQKTKVAPKQIKPEWIVSLYQKRHIADPNVDAIGLAVQKRIFTDVYLYGSADANGNYAFGIGIGF